MEQRCSQCNRLADRYSNMCRACGYDVRLGAATVIDVRDTDPERDIIDLISAVLAADGHDDPRPPKRFESGNLRVDPLIALEGANVLPAAPDRRTRVRR